MPSAKSFAVAALAASGVHAGACKPSPTTEVSTTITEAPTTTTASTASTAPCTYTLKEDTSGLNCGTAGRDARDSLPDGDSASLEDCAKSCIEDQGSDESCQLFEYTPSETDGSGICKRYADYFLTADDTGSSRYYEPGCFECVRGEPNTRGGRGGARGGGRRLRRMK